MARHSFEAHTGDVEIRLEAESLPALFAEAARAVAELMGRPGAQAAGDWEAIVVEAPDADALLIDWLNELVVRSEVEHQLFVEVVVDAVSDRRIEARVRGWPIAEAGTPIKAATLHGLHLEARATGVDATVHLGV